VVAGSTSQSLSSCAALLSLWYPISNRLALRWHALDSKLIPDSEGVNSASRLELNGGTLALRGFQVEERWGSPSVLLRFSPGRVLALERWLAASSPERGRGESTEAGNDRDPGASGRN
jgi:hypothetical protein